MKIEIEIPEQEENKIEDGGLKYICEGIANYISDDYPEFDMEKIIVKVV